MESVRDQIDLGFATVREDDTSFKEKVCGWDHWNVERRLCQTAGV